MRASSPNDLAAAEAPPLPVSVYTPSPALQRVGPFLAGLGRDLVAGRELAWRLFVRDISAQYRQSLLGVTWAFLPPILTGLVFVALQSQRVIDPGATKVAYPVFALVGTLTWQVFVDAIQAPLRAVTNAKPILAKIQFPREALILSAAYGVVFNAFLKGIVLAGVLVLYGIAPTPGLALVPLALALLVALGMALGLALTPLGLLYNDVSSGLLVVLPIWFFATPVVYPAPDSGAWSLVTSCNPVSPLLIATRDLLVAGSLSDPAGFAWMGVLALALLVVATAGYRIALPILTERMSA